MHACGHLRGIGANRRWRWGTLIVSRRSTCCRVVWPFVRLSPDCDIDLVKTLSYTEAVERFKKWGSESEQRRRKRGSNFYLWTPNLKIAGSTEPPDPNRSPHLVVSSLFRVKALVGSQPLKIVVRALPFGYISFELQFSLRNCLVFIHTAHCTHISICVRSAVAETRLKKYCM